MAGFDTKLSKAWKQRQWFITVFLFALGAWFFYDGYIGFPKKNLRYDRYRELEQSGQAKLWPEEARKNGWPDKIPEKRYSNVDLKAQLVLGVVCTLAGIAAALWLASAYKQRLTCDGTTIFGTRGEQVPIASITAIDRKKWDSKGIAYAIYSSGGKTRHLTLDDYKFAGAEEILKAVEKNLEPR